ncbi:MAG: DUF5662 family protein [Elusimicrobiota bacterium]
MKKYYLYLKYVVIHKVYVFIECCKLGILLRGILHDFSKFYPSEMIPNVKFHYGPDKKVIRNKSGYYRKFECGDEIFESSYLLHVRRNDHHWHYWSVTKDDGTTKEFPMSNGARKEMLADWIGAAKAQRRCHKTWYWNNKEKIIIHPETRKWIEENL